jgi:hypothetical protein
MGQVVLRLCAGRADPVQTAVLRHCERSAAIQSRTMTPWIAALRSQ